MVYSKKITGFLLGLGISFLSCFDAVADPTKDTLHPELKNYVPTLHPEIVEDRLKCLQKDVKLTYNKEILNHINFYAVKQRNYTKTIIERSSFYFPIFEEILKKHNMPDEIKYLSIVESALKPRAASWAAAVGLWQFIPGTGKQYDLQQDHYIDERMDIYKSTEAACKYLKYLHNMFGDWQLALASYNCGEGRVLQAVRMAGGKPHDKNIDFWKVYKYLPQETRSYVPAFIAVNYIMNYSNEHFIFGEDMQVHIPSDTIHVNQFVNIEEFAKQIDVPKEHLEQLNPHLKKNAIPAYKRNYPLRYPSHKKEHLATNRHAILSASNRASRREMLYVTPENIVPSTTEGKTKIIHTVQYGESLPSIANKYGVSAWNMQTWNNMQSVMIHPNQALAVWVLPNSPFAKMQNNNANNNVAKNNVNNNVAKVASNNNKVHIIQSGDNLWDISSKYNTTVDNLKKWNKLYGNFMLMPGQKIIVKQ